MDGIMFAKNMLKNQNAQKLLEEKLQFLIDTYFQGKSDYAIEKFIKSFGEGMIYLEDSLMYSRGIHPVQTRTNFIDIIANKEKLVKKSDEVERILINEINRQARHFLTILSEF